MGAASCTGALRLLRCWHVLWLALLLVVAAPSRAAPSFDPGDRADWWLDASALVQIDQVPAIRPDQWRPVGSAPTVQLDGGALWVRVPVPALPAGQRWFLELTGAALIDHADLYTLEPQGQWSVQRAGDQLAMADWAVPHVTPLFRLPAGEATTVYLRLQNRPTPVSVLLKAYDEAGLQANTRWTYLLMGGYVGFGLLVGVLGWMHGRLYGDRVFVPYSIYVLMMLGFQVTYTGLGALFLWPGWAGFNDIASPLFMLWMVGSGMWLLREGSSVARYSRLADRIVQAAAVFGAVFAPLYVLLPGPSSLKILLLYSLVAVILSTTVYFWTWRMGERYAGWLFLGFLPIHLAYPFPSLRTQGLIADSWATQYALVLGSVIEIPLLLFILHRRARDFSENSARLRAIDVHDPLTGLPILPVLRLRLRDAVRRARRAGQQCALLMVELANRDEIAETEGREIADRAVVVTAALLSSAVRDIDSVCRVSGARFALLLEGPQPDKARRDLAQLIVARGLKGQRLLPPHLKLRFRISSANLPGGGIELGDNGRIDETRLLRRVEVLLERMAKDDPKRVVHHWDAPSSVGGTWISGPDSSAASAAAAEDIAKPPDTGHAAGRHAGTGEPLATGGPAEHAGPPAA